MMIYIYIIIATVKKSSISISDYLTNILSYSRLHRYQYISLSYQHSIRLIIIVIISLTQNVITWDMGRYTLVAAKDYLFAGVPS